MKGDVVMAKQKVSEETKKKAKSLGIKSWHLKSEKKLLDEISEIEGGKASPVEKKETPPPKQPTVSEEVMNRSIHVLGNKSPYWKIKNG